MRTRNVPAVPKLTRAKPSPYRGAVHLTPLTRSPLRLRLRLHGGRSCAAAVLLALGLAACGGQDPALGGPPAPASAVEAAPTASAASTPTAPVPTVPTVPAPTAEPAETPPPAAETTAEATAEPAPAPSAQETTEQVDPAPQTPRSGSGTFATAALDTAPAGEGRVVRIAIQVEEGVPVDPMDFAAQVLATLTDPRGWQAVDGIACAATIDPGSAAVIVTLATPTTTDRLCYPLDTGGWLDCYNRGRAVINSDRWLLGAQSWGADIAGYRQMVVNHEVGHALGHGHLFCPAAGAPAPVMQQQTISLQGCAPNGWPTVTGG